ncbi:methyltransferase domain-containing protein [Trametes elegans]|nr:methyltransferase domain-containing protein [Trametes elegans]
MTKASSVPTHDRLAHLVDFLTSPIVASLYDFHPNDLGTSGFRPPAEWEDWWDWAGADYQDADDKATEPWLCILNYYDFCRSSEEGPGQLCSDASEATLPVSVRCLVEQACSLAVSREFGRTIYPDEGKTYYAEGANTKTHHNPDDALPGMSPKKAHEVIRMSQFVGDLLAGNASLSSIQHVVDVGAGQAYLSRMLRDRHGLHVLALDYSDVQTQGAAKRDAPKRQRASRSNGPTKQRSPVHGRDRKEPETTGSTEDVPDSPASRGSLTYVTAKIDPETLLDSTHGWIDRQLAAANASSPSGCSPSTAQREPSPAPVLFVALHACGSLTPDILRAFAAALKAEPPSHSPPGPVLAEAAWTPAAAAVVGCCYNMLRPEDVPLSAAMRTARPRFTLSPGHLQIAAQVPAGWARTPETLRGARVALRKVVWRALIQDTLAAGQPAADARIEAGGRSSLEAKSAAAFAGKVGRGEALNSVEGDAGVLPEGGGEGRRFRRLGRLNDAAYADWETFTQRVQAKLGLPPLSSPPDRRQERRVEVFHVLRCVVGPVVESLLMLDRAAWVEEKLESTGLGVQLVNIFDQASGSGRNVAIVIQPQGDHGETNQ